jgi:hypothetical protein
MSQEALKNQQALSEQKQKDQDQNNEGCVEKAPSQRKPFALPGRQPNEDAHRECDRDQ